VSLLLIAVLASDNLGEIGEMTHKLAEARPSRRSKCTVTGADTFQGALSIVLASQAIAPHCSISINRATATATVYFHRQGASGGVDLSTFGKDKRILRFGLEVEARLAGSVLGYISSDLAKIAADLALHPIILPKGHGS
jgi:hypothetical protein